MELLVENGADVNTADNVMPLVFIGALCILLYYM